MQETSISVGLAASLRTLYGPLATRWKSGPTAVGSPFSASARKRRRNQDGRSIPLLICCVLLLVGIPFASARDRAEALPGTLVTKPVLEEKLAKVQDATNLTEEAREQLTKLYRESLSNLVAAQANKAATAAYRDTAETAPAEIASLRNARAEILADDPLTRLDLAANHELVDLERLLREEQADLAVVQARHDDFVAQLALEEDRPAAVREQLSKADLALASALKTLQAEATEPIDGAMAEARRWKLQSRAQALSSEVKMLQQEQLIHPVRLELLGAQRDEAAASSDRVAARIAALEERILDTRKQAALQARADAERVRLATQGMAPAVTRLSEANAELSRDIGTLTASMSDLVQARVRTERLVERIDADYRDIRDTLEAGQFSDDLGEVLLEQFNALPNLGEIRGQRAQRRALIGQTKTQRLRQRSEARSLRNVEASIAALAAELDTAPTQAQEEWLRDLVTQRLALLERMLETEERYLAKVQALNVAEDALLTLVANYDALLREHLVWLRTERSVDLNELFALTKQFDAMLATAQDAALDSRLAVPLSTSPLFWAALLVSAVLLWFRRRFIAIITDVAGNVGKPTTDSFGHTLRVLGLTVLLALSLPLPMGAVGWVLLTEPIATEVTRALGDSLLRIALLIFAMQLLIALSRPKGLAAVHFRWSEQTLALLRTQTRRLSWVLIPSELLLHLTVVLHPLQSGGTPGRVAATVAFAALAWFLFQVFHPRRGVMTRLVHREDYQLLLRGYWLWYPLLVVYPLAFLGLGLAGYLYTATVEMRNFVDSLLLLLAAALLNALALRWLLVVRRRLAYEAAKRNADGKNAELQVEEQKLDIVSLSDDTRRLIRVGVGVFVVAGLALIWSDALPALRVLDEQTLWHTTVTVGGEKQQHPVTLLDLGLAILFAAGTLVLLKRLPALLEILLLRHHRMFSADRYAITTLTSYVLGAAGILLVLDTLGASWTQLQWMAAALSVGIGFGLQEIVANFISGLIILFERPVRVGDTITVGDTSGVVTRIRIRATTIRNFDRKELLVPNKEFITERLLNWTLSDPVTRIVVVVGVAYGSDVDKALAIMKGVAEEHAHVVDDPPPVVTFDTFGDNALTLTLRAFVDSIMERLTTITELNRAINHAFAEAGLNIAFPQRDVHLDTTRPVRIELLKGKQSNRGANGESSDSP